MKKLFVLTMLCTLVLPIMAETEISMPPESSPEHPTEVPSSVPADAPMTETTNKQHMEEAPIQPTDLSTMDDKIDDVDQETKMY